MTNEQQKISIWLQTIGKELGMTLNLGEDGHCTLLCGDKLQCVVEVPADNEAEAVFVYLPMLRLPYDEIAQLSLLKAALELNMFGLETGGSNISLDTRSQYIVLTFSIGISMLEEESFKQMLGDFLDVGVELYDKFQKVAGGKTQNREAFGQLGIRV